MRDTSIQYMRVASMVIIVFYHCLCYYGIWNTIFPTDVIYCNIDSWRELCNYALNTFVFLSGILYASTTHTSKGLDVIRKKGVRLIIPYVTWGLICIVVFHPSDWFLDFFSGMMHLWFLMMLFGLFLVCELLNVRRISSKYLVVTGACCMCMNIVANKVGGGGGNLLCYKQIVAYYPAFAFGVITHRIRYRSFGSALYVLFGVSLLMAVIFGLSRELPFGLLYMSLPTYISLMCIYLVFDKISNRLKTGKVLEYLDRHSFGIYLIHHVLIWCMLMFIPGCRTLMDNHYYLAPISMFMIVFPLSWTLSVILSRFSLLSQLLFGSKSMKIHFREKTSLLTL